MPTLPGFSVRKEEVTDRVHRAESNIEPVEQLVEVDLRKRRLRLKDDIAAYLREGERQEKGIGVEFAFHSLCQESLGSSWYENLLAYLTWLLDREC